MEEERLNFVPYVISLRKSLDEEKDEKPSLPIPMIPDEVERSGPDEVIWVLDEEEEEETKKEEETKREKAKKNEKWEKEMVEMGERGRRSKRRRRLGEDIGEGPSSSKLLKVNTKSQEKIGKQVMIVNNKEDKAIKKNIDLANELKRTKSIVDQLLEDKQRLTNENKALREELTMNNEHLTKKNLEMEELHAKLYREKELMKKKMKAERKRAKVMMELANISSDKVTKFSFDAM